MKVIYLIGGMGAGKSSAASALSSCGLPVINLDLLGHEVLEWPETQHELCKVFGDDVVVEGKVDRKLLARRAFVSEEDTKKLNAITQPRIQSVFERTLKGFEYRKCKAVVVEHSVFRKREEELGDYADIILAVVAPEEERIARCVNAGWDEQDVRNRLKRQISDEKRREVSDVVFENSGSKEQLIEQVSRWWEDYSAQLE